MELAAIALENSSKQQLNLDITHKIRTQPPTFCSVSEYIGAKRVLRTGQRVSQNSGLPPSSIPGPGMLNRGLRRCKYCGKTGIGTITQLISHQQQTTYCHQMKQTVEGEVEDSFSKQSHESDNEAQFSGAEDDYSVPGPPLKE